MLNAIFKVLKILTNKNNDGNFQEFLIHNEIRERK